jgi:hypothetical protein
MNEAERAAEEAVRLAKGEKARGGDNQQRQKKRACDHAETRGGDKGQYQDNGGQRRIPDIEEH